MFVSTGVGCTRSPSRSKTERQLSGAPGRTRCHPEPGRPFRANVGEGLAVRPARVDYPLHHPHPGPTRRKSSKMNTYAECAATPCRMRTYKIVGLKASWNEHLQRMGVGEGSYCYPRARSLYDAAMDDPESSWRGYAE